jgi:hypothetical protein
LLDATGFHGYPALAKQCFSDVTSSHRGAVGWLNSTGCMGDKQWKERGKGVYVVDADKMVLNEGRAILPTVPAKTVISRSWSDTVWVLAEDEKLYVARADLGTKPVSVVVLNGGSPVKDSSGVEPLVIEAVTPAPGGRAWAMASTRHATPGVWSKIYQLEVEGDRIKVKRQLEDQLPRSSIISTSSDRTDPDRLWVRTYDRNWYEVGPGAGAELVIKRLFVEGSPVLSTIIGNKDQHDHYWLAATPTNYLMGPASELSSAVIELGSVKLTLAKAPRVMVPIVPSELGSVNVHFDWPNRPEAATVQGRVSVDVIRPAATQRDQDDAVAGGTARMVAGSAEVHLRRSDRFIPDRDYDVLVVYADDNRTSIQTRWHHVDFGLPWWKRFLRAPLVASLLWLLLPIGLVCALFRDSAPVRAWAPVMIPFVEAIGTILLPEYAKPEYAKLSVPHFLASAALVTVTAVVAGVTSPAAFRAIAASHPFKPIVPFALRVGLLRRRVFARYMSCAEEEVGRRKAAANDERYVPLPIAVKEVAANRGPMPAVSDHVTISALVDALLVTAPEERIHLVIEAPGGRGKSALLHAIFERVIARWHEVPGAPLPVLCNADATTLEERAKIAFGSDAVSVEHLALQLATGDLVLFVDGLSESRIDPGILERFLRDTGRRTRLCVAMRPSPDFWRAIAANADRYLRVEPQRLTDETIDEFLLAYASPTKATSPSAPDAKAGAAGQMALKSRLQYFRGFDGSYVPLLVRLAMLADEDTSASISDVYDSCFARLLRSQSITAPADRNELERAAQDLSLATYVERQQRIFSTNREEVEEKASIARLLTCGVLVSADHGSRLEIEPRAVRFFHDSMQSYLAAKALGRKGRWDIFLRAAGDEGFRRARSDILGRSGSELFFMCVLGFGTAEAVADYLFQELSTWAALHANSFSADQITGAIPEVLRVSKAYVSPEGRDVASYLNAAIALADRLQTAQPDDLARQRRDYLAVLYSTLAPSVWAKMSASPS